MDWITKNIVRIAIGLVAVVLLLGFLQLRSCQADRQRAAQSKVDRGQGEAGVDAGAEAGNTLGNVMETDRRIGEAVKGGRDEILSRPAGNSNDAAIRAACRMRSHCGDRRCAALRETDPAVASCRNAIGATP